METFTGEQREEFQILKDRCTMGAWAALALIGGDPHYQLRILRLASHVTGQTKSVISRADMSEAARKITEGV